MLINHPVTCTCTVHSVNFNNNDDDDDDKKILVFKQIKICTKGAGTTSLSQVGEITIST